MTDAEKIRKLVDGLDRLRDYANTIAEQSTRNFEAMQARIDNLERRIPHASDPDRLSKE